MSDQEQAQHIKERLFQYSPTFYPAPHTPLTQQTVGPSPGADPYNHDFAPQEETAKIQEIPVKRREFSAVKAGLILLFALILSGALIIYALTRFIG